MSHSLWFLHVTSSSNAAASTLTLSSVQNLFSSPGSIGCFVLSKAFLKSSAILHFIVSSLWILSSSSVLHPVSRHCGWLSLGLLF